MLTTVGCPVCQNLCSAEAASCPRCGHPFKKDQPVSANRSANIWKILTIGVGILLIGAVGFTAYRAFGGEGGVVSSSNAPEPSSTANRATAANTTIAPLPIVTPTPTGSVTLQAGIDYSYGGIQPVSRGEFHLLDADLNKILSEAGIKRNEEGGAKSPIDQLAFGFMFPDAFGSVVKKALPAIRKHSKYSLTTDFDGKARLDGVNTGKYFIYGYTSTRKGYAIWNLQLEVKVGQNSVLLDNNNAASAF